MTANYHIQRSRLEFRRALPDLDLVLHPVYPPEVQDSLWVVKPRILALLAGEYHKFAGAWVRAVAQDIVIWMGAEGDAVSGFFSNWSLPDLGNFTWPEFLGGKAS